MNLQILEKIKSTELVDFRSKSLTWKVSCYIFVDLICLVALFSYLLSSWLFFNWYRENKLCSNQFKILELFSYIISVPSKCLMLALRHFVVKSWSWISLLQLLRPLDLLSQPLMDFQVNIIKIILVYVFSFKIQIVRQK